MNIHALEVLEWGRIKEILLRYANTPLCKREIEKLLPAGSRVDIESEFRLVREAIELLNATDLPSWSGIRVISHYLSKMKTGWYMDGEELLSVKDFLVAVARFRLFFGSLKDFPGLRKLGSKLKTFDGLVELIDRLITPDGKVDSSASLELERVRKSIKVLESRLDRRLREMVVSSKYAPYLQESVFTVRNGRYVLPVKRGFKNSFPGVVHDQSSSGMTIFMEPIEIVSIDNELQDLRALEEKEVQRILRELSFKVLAREDDILLAEAVLGRLDFIFAKAEFAIEKKASIPEISEKKRFFLRNVRHPLLGDRAVPITIHLGRDFKQLVITGPNTGGKTVTLKTVGVNVLLALSGVPVLADEGSYIYPFREVWVDIGDEQSIEQNLSTFSSHIKNILEILKNVRDDDIVLLDELGAGTDPVEGSALALSILEEIKEIGVLAIVATHYPALKQYAFSNDEVENASVEFDPKTLRPTYRLAIGIPGGSNALAIAKSLGIPERVVKRAKKFMGEQNVNFNDIIYEINRLKEELKKRKEALLKEKSEWEHRKKKYIDKLEYLKEYEKKIKKDISKRAERLIKDFSEEIDSYWKMASTMNAGKRYAAGKELFKALSEQVQQFKVKETLSEGKGISIKQVKPGDRVLLRRLGLEGVVEDVDVAKNAIWVVSGSVRGRFRADELTPVERKEESNRVSVDVEVSKPTEAVPSSIMIRHMLRDEASIYLKNFLDKAYRAGYPSVSIIHGRGEGILRNEVRNILSRLPYVKSYRYGALEEGGDGVTIVYFDR